MRNFRKILFGDVIESIEKNGTSYRLTIILKRFDNRVHLKFIHDKIRNREKLLPEMIDILKEYYQEQEKTNLVFHDN